MASSITKDNLFVPSQNKAEAKGDMTTRVAHSILHAEVIAREAKTARLRAARLAIEATQEPAPAKPARRKKPAA
ncbi:MULTISPECIES: hypothetical protein [Aminobacter]|uniref:Uncharacterized protein n=1 Tax=Aminobacter niigataensis TaxID=83265 RepID=A0ABR6L475_9HYPH|nr:MULTISPECIES: hypothetical protein [Aminobacter]AWC21553.1 hypothetical protein CO731_01004 [Aminobacter sp. MSH1]MBB4651607.1 hypothetical protein [Aminobacter niigataensis]CAI2932187.1 conserved protein of unknown function [Aminobacter niigataensis]